MDAGVYIVSYLLTVYAPYTVLKLKYKPTYTYLIGFICLHYGRDWSGSIPFGGTIQIDPERISFLEPLWT